MRGLGCLVLLIVIVGGLFAADLAVTSYAEQRTSQRVERTLDADADVQLQGWPVSLRMLLDTIPTARVEANDVPLREGATLDQLDVELNDVEITIDDLTGAEDRLPAAREGTFEAQLGEASVSALLGIPSGLAEVALEDGVVRVGAGELSIEATVEARDGDAVVILQGPIAAVLGGSQFAIDLSDEPGRPAVESVDIRQGVMVVQGRLEEVDR